MNIDFTSDGNSDAFVVMGFSRSEALGRWSIGGQSMVKLPVPDGSGMLVLKVVLQPLIIEGAKPCQRLVLLANGQKVHDASHTKWATLQLRLPEIHASHLTLTLLHPDAVAPSSLCTSRDDRRLAFFVKAISLERAEEAGEPSSPARPAPGEVAAVPATATVSPDVFVASDGWLFLIGGTNAVLRYYTDPDYFTHANATAWAGLLAGRQVRLARMGVQYFHLGAPDKISVYPEMLRSDLTNLHRHPIRLLDEALAAAGCAEVLVNPLPAFASHPQRERLFLKTDTHWSYLASMVVVEMVTQRIGAPRVATLAGREIRTYRHTFDLGSKITPPITEEGIVVAMRSDLARSRANELATRFETNVQQGKPVTHTGINLVFRSTNPDAIDKTLVIFGDSFMDFQESSTTVALAEVFRETHFIWSPRIDFGYVARVQADIVLTETAERFMIQLPNDDYNLDLDNAERLRNYPA